MTHREAVCVAAALSTTNDKDFKLFLKKYGYRPRYKKKVKANGNNGV